MKNKKGISGVVAAVLMIALVMAVAVIVWVVVRNVIGEQTGRVESCFGIYDKVTINSRYTCYDASEDEFRFSINIGDIEVDEVLVSISSQGNTNSYAISSEDQTSLDSYPTSGEAVTIPGQNSGKTYVLEISTEPDVIQISPIRNGQQCDVSDSLSEIDVCI